MDGNTYLQTMRVEKGSKITQEQWGGFLEASVMAQRYSCRVAIFQKELTPGGQASFKPLMNFGQKDGSKLKGTIGISYNGSHYTLLKLSEDIIRALA